MDEKLEIRPLVLTKEKVISIWSKYKNVPMAFEAAWNDIDVFYDHLASPRSVFFEIGDEVGLVSASNIVPGLDGQLAVVMFDRRIKGRDSVIIRAVREIFHLTNAIRLSAFVPEHKYVMVNLLKRLGFKVEGQIRKAFVNNGKLEDIYMFGMLRRELEG